MILYVYYNVFAWAQSIQTFSETPSDPRQTRKLERNVKATEPVQIQAI